MATHSSILFLENPHGQRSLVGCSPWGCKELYMTEGQTFTDFFSPYFKWGLEYKISLQWAYAVTPAPQPLESCDPAEPAEGENVFGKRNSK